MNRAVERQARDWPGWKLSVSLPAGDISASGRFDLGSMMDDRDLADQRPAVGAGNLRLQFGGNDFAEQGAVYVGVTASDGHQILGTFEFIERCQNGSLHVR